MTQSTDATATQSWLDEQSRSRPGLLARSWAIWSRKPAGLIGGLIILSMVFIALTAPLLAPHDPGDFVGSRLETPSSQFPLGTDSLGRDVLSRTIYGAQVSIAVGVAATLMGIAAGSTLGAVSAFAGGWVDLIIQRILEVVASFPSLILALIMIAVLGRAHSQSSNLLVIAWDLRAIEVAIAIAFIFSTMRIVRSAVMRERNLPYIEAATVIGVGSARMLYRHILPNVLPYIIVAFSVLIGVAILVEASLSFLGFGVSSGTPSWGADLSARNREYFSEAPWLMIGPGVALSLTVLGYNFFGDALRDILDPRLRGSR